jgi:hypothetical protein
MDTLYVTPSAAQRLKSKVGNSPFEVFSVLLGRQETFRVTTSWGYGTTEDCTSTVYDSTKVCDVRIVDGSWLRFKIVATGEFRRVSTSACDMDHNCLALTDEAFGATV